MLTNSCTACGICTDSCEFLKKYHMNLSDLEKKHPELCWECFHCGECGRRCPEKIDGRALSLELRKAYALAGDLDKKAYRSTILEKKNYLFKKYHKGSSGTVLFPGCNFPSFFSGTTKKLIDIFRIELGASVAFDCCGKPIAELGMESESKVIIEGLNQRLRKIGATELVTACPNCFYYLKDKLEVEVMDIYSKLGKMGFKPKLSAAEYNVYIPCPDRGDRAILGNIRLLLNSDSTINTIEDVQCCGLGGLAASRGFDIPHKLAYKLREQRLDSIYTYCATCCGSFNRSGIAGVQHFLLHLLKEEEIPPKGISSVLNRAGFRFAKF